MAEYISAKEASRLWNITERSVTGLCRAGRIEGAVKNGRDWSIPVDAEKPTDKRLRTGAYKNDSKRTARLPLLLVMLPPIIVLLYSEQSCKVK